MSPRPEGRRDRGCFIQWTPGGLGRLCFRWPARTGKLYRVTTDFRRDRTRELERARDLIGAEIMSGVFCPEVRFPSLFAPKVSIPSPFALGLADEMKAWVAEKELRPGIRKSRTRDYQSHLDNYFETGPLARCFDRPPTIEALERFQIWLRSEAGEAGTGLSEKTAANVIKSTLRAFLRDRRVSLATVDLLRWEDTAPTTDQDPFTAEDRDALLAWFSKKRPNAEYVSLVLRFRGVTPSEVRGLKVGDFSRATGALNIRRSQNLGEENATKTRARRRAVVLERDVAALVQGIAGIRSPKERLFSVAEDTLRDNFTKAQQALGLAHRSLYQTKHTYATLALLAGENPAEVASSLGISLATLDRNYAASLKAGRVAVARAAKKGSRRAS